jgi:type IV pilus assembly protein PilQ
VVKSISIVREKLRFICVGLTLMAASLISVCYAQSVPTLVTVSAVELQSSQVVLKTDSRDLEFESYTLGAPARLVVDIKNALPEFTERTFTIGSGYSGMRIGLYADKTRFVFDAASSQLPEAKVFQRGTDLVVDWGDVGAEVPVEFTPPVKKSVVKKGAPTSVETINFDAAGGISLFTVGLSGFSEMIEPQVDGDVIRFGLKNTVIPRSLRRVVDASVFPSSVLQITPYSTIVEGVRNVMFVARMKGPVDYRVEVVDSNLILRTVDGPFAEPAPQKMSTVTIPVDSVGSVEPSTAVDVGQDQVAQVIESLAAVPVPGFEDGAIGTDEEPVKIYTGEPVTLVFDDADIRKVMQLLAEISDMNLILADTVEGEISLRLHDVPWDQALDLILEIKELGTITQGNVVRVLPKKQIQAMEADKLRAKKSIKKLEETRTHIFEVSYKDTDTIESVIEDILSDQGEVKTIDGSKKIMVNDIPSKIDEVKDLLAVLDEPVKQVMIEARIVEMRNTEGLDLGINWGINYTNDAVPDINSSGTVTNADGSSSEVTIERENGIQTTTIKNVDADGNETSSEGTQGIALGSNVVNDAAFGLGGAFLLPATVGTSGLGGLINFGRLGVDSTVINLRISALEATGTAKVVSSPKVLTLDGEAAKIEQGTSIPYQSVSEKGTVTEFEDATLSLEVTPEVNPDNSVILEIKASNSTIGSTVSTGAGSAPSIDTKEAETKLMLKDGETTVIGGIYIDNSVSSNTGTPFLKDLPFIGKLFESNSSSSDRSELLIFITPHIIEQ